MMWMLMFFFMGFINFKEFLMFSSKMEFNFSNNFMLLISLIFLIMYMSMKFNNNMDSEFKNSLNWMFFLILLISNLMFCSNTFMLTLLMIELSIYPMLKLFMKLSKDEEKLYSLMFMFNINISGSLLFMYSVSKFLMEMNTTNIMFMTHLNKSMLITLFFCFMLLTKVPMIFFQFWLGKAHVSASGSCSMLLASIMLKLGSYGLLKYWSLMKMNWMMKQEMMFSLNLYCMIVMSMIMMRFNDLKLLVAYSSILHMAATIPFTFNYTTMGIISVLITMSNHGILSCMFFFLVTMMYEISLSREISFNKNLESYNKSMTLMLFMMVFLNLGIPPFAGFYSELVYMSVINKYSIFCLMLMLISLFLCILYSMMMILSFNYGKNIYMAKKYMNMNILKVSSSSFFFMAMLVYYLN